jgi:penicillin-binding protein 2
MPLDEERREALDRRLYILFFIIFVALSILVLRLIVLQLSKGEQFRALARANRFDTEPIAAPRGSIYDREGQLLVRNQPGFQITYTLPTHASLTPRQIAARLAPVLGLSAKDVLQRMDSGPDYRLPPSVPRSIVFQPTWKEVSFIQEHQADLPGVAVSVLPVRQYTRGMFASHVIGYLHSMSRHDADRYQKQGVRLDAPVGHAGVEETYESYLRGRDGVYRLELNRFGQRVRQEVVDAPKRGDDIQLTLDAHLQMATEEALRAQIEYLQHRPKNPLSNVKTAAAVAMDPRTGEILALASYPEYNPQVFVGGISMGEYQKFRPAEMNRVIQSPLAPGSTVKPLTVMMGLQEGKITPRTVVNDRGFLTIGWRADGTPWRPSCWLLSGHGPETARRAIATSCNVYMYQLSLWLGGYPPRNQNMDDWVAHRLPRVLDRIRHYHQSFGLGALTGIDLPGEVSGSFHDRGLLADLPFSAIGQNEAYTAIELADYVSTVANGGKRLRPYVVRAIRNPRGQIVKETKPRVLNQVDVSPENIRVAQEGMALVTQGEGTAASTFQQFPIKVAAKTGTAETMDPSQDNALFIGYAPYDHPRIAIAVIVPGGGHGSDSSGPVALKMLKAYFRLA